MDVEKEFLLEKYKTIFRNVPLTKLSKKAKRLVEACLNDKTDFTDQEMDVLAGVVQRYGKAVQDSKVSDVLENQEKVINTINTEHELLDLLEKEVSDQFLTVDLPLKDGKHRVTFQVLPITDSRAITTLETHANLFNDFSVEEKNIFNQGQNNLKDLSEAEIEVYNHLLERLNNNALANSEEMIIELLSHQLQIGDTLDVETNKKIWNKMPFNIKMGVFMRVEEMLGLKDFDTRELFPVTQ
jgi:hypothetical protein